MTEPMTIAIVSAMHEELAAVLALMPDERKQVAAGGNSGAAICRDMRWLPCCRASARWRRPRPPRRSLNALACAHCVHRRGGRPGAGRAGGRCGGGGQLFAARPGRVADLSRVTRCRLYGAIPAALSAQTCTLTQRLAAAAGRQALPGLCRCTAAWSSAATALCPPPRRPRCCRPLARRAGGGDGGRRHRPGLPRLRRAVRGRAHRVRPRRRRGAWRL
jgi:hypothetical protein